MLNIRKMSLIAPPAIALVVVLGAWFAHDRLIPPSDPPALAIQFGNTEIEWVVGKQIWSGNYYDREDNFKRIMSGTVAKDLPYVANGENISIKIDGNIPDSVELSEYLLRESGDQKYNIGGMPYDFSFGVLSRVGIFDIKPNWATVLSSSTADYFPGNTIKGYRLICTWGNNRCEYAFVVRGDAAQAHRYMPIDAITLVAWKDGYSNRYSLFSDDITPAPSELSSSRVFVDIAELNAALAEYPRDTIQRVVIMHTLEFTKEEGQAIADTIVIPSGNYVVTAGYYEYPGPEFPAVATTLHEAYYQVVLKLCEMGGPVYGIKYVAIDMAGVLESARAPLETKLSALAAAVGWELLVDTYEGLAQSGYVVHGGFREGILISFGNSSFDGATFIVEASRFHGNLGAFGSTFTAQFSMGSWMVDLLYDTDGSYFFWVS